MALTLCEELGGLPLALDQAGAYIEETDCSLADYLHLFKRRRADLLTERRGHLVDDHPLPVATIWSLSFQNVEVQNPAAADLLRLCALLAPDAIPETIITQGAPHLGPNLAPVGADGYLLNQAIEVLCAYSLLSRETSSEGSLLSVHRLVQAVLKDQMDESSRQVWEERIVQAVSAALPPVEHGQWPVWERILAHALVAHDIIEHYHLQDEEVTQLLQQTGWYLTERARYQEAELLLTHALSISEHKYGLEHVETARNSSTLGYLYQNQGKYEQAEPLYVRALAIQEQQLGPLHPDTANSLNNLAALYHDQGKDEQAEPLFQRALTIHEQVLGPNHPDTALSLWWLATLARKQQHDQEAKAFYQRAYSIYKQTLGETHPTTQRIRQDLASLLQAMGDDAQATTPETNDTQS